jgi:hypothetical protein
VYDKLKQRGMEASALKPDGASYRLEPDSPSSSLSVRAARGVAYRAEASRVGRALSKAKKTARRSLEKFAASAEMDKEIAKTVRGQYPSDRSD